MDVLFLFLRNLLRLFSGLLTYCKERVRALFFSVLCSSVVALKNLLLETGDLGLKLSDFVLICTSLQGLMLTLLLELVEIFDQIPVHRLKVIPFNFQLVILFHRKLEFLLLPVV